MKKSIDYEPVHRHAKLLSPIKKMDFDLFMKSNPNIEIRPSNSNKIFAKKLKEIFTLHKGKGDTFFKIKDCTCHCEDCRKSYPDKYLYAFIGNVSNDYFTFAIGINSHYEPVYIRMPRDSEYSINEVNKGTSKYDETVPNQIYGNVHTFSIADDETDDFYAGNDYLDLISQRNKAFEKLESKDNIINTYIELKDWLTDYKIGEEFLGIDYKILEEFNLLYGELESFYTIYFYIEIAKDAMVEYHNLDINIKDDLTKWLIKYEDFRNEQLGCLALKLFGVEGEYLNFLIIKEYKISLSVFGDILPFIKIYEKYSSLILLWEKYRDKNEASDLKVKYCLDKKYFSLQKIR